MLRVLRRDEVDGHWHEVCSDPSYLRPKIHLCMRGIASWKLKDFNVSVEIENEKVAGRMTCFMPYERIHLGGSWSAIVQIVPDRRGPGEQSLSQQNGEECHQHPTHKWDEDIRQTKLLIRKCCFADADEWRNSFLCALRGT